MALDCVYWRTLPHAGGVLDQPAGLLTRMREAHQAYQAMRAYRRDGLVAGKMAHWRLEHPDLAEIVDRIKRLRKPHGR